LYAKRFLPENARSGGGKDRGTRTALKGEVFSERHAGIGGVKRSKTGLKGM